MLIDKYLPTYDFNEFHSIEIHSSISDVYQKMLQVDFSNSSLINFLFRIRGIGKTSYAIGNITKMGFIKLDEVPGKEILFGIVTDSPVFNGCQSITSQKDFVQQSGVSIMKGVVNFCVKDHGSSNYSISTETRVWCGGRKIKSKFRLYWFFVKPFSQLIRKHMLKQIRKQIQ